MQDLRNIIADLERQKAAIENALAALRDVSGTEAPKRRGRPPGSGAKRGPGRPPKKQVRFTDAGRQRLAEAMKQRWAAKRAGSKKRGRKASKKAASA